MHSRPMALISVAALLSLGVAACGSSSPKKKSSSTSSAPTAGTINGAGSTFEAPIISQWGNALASQGVTVNYQAVGSGAGVAQFIATQGF